MAERPDLAAVRAYIGVPATALSDDDLQRIYSSCDEAQRVRCHGFVDETTDPPTDLTDVPEPLNQAFLRRVQREVAARNLPLGLVGVDAEYGASRIPVFDALVEEAERPYRKQVVG
jgi:hypothetical protein